MKYLVRKIMFLLLTIWAALTINFVLPRLMPGNPAEVMVAKFRGKITPQAMNALKIAFGIDVHQNIFVQYFRYIQNTMKGNFGISITYFPMPVKSMLAQSIPWTLGLVGTSTIIAFTLGTLLGIKSAWKRNNFLADMSVPIGLFLKSIPYFWLALLFLYLFSFKLSWFPLAGGSSGKFIGFKEILDILYHSILPAFTIVVAASGGWILTMRNNMISVLSEDYITFAAAKGLKEKEIMYKYGARNAILPNMTGFAMALGFIIGGSLLTEMVFSYPGVGYILYQAVESLDYPLMQAIFLFISLAVLAANFLADVTYVLLDPRVRNGGKE